MIVGLGIDITEIGRVAALLEKYGDRFTHKIYTAAERSFASARGNPAQHYAARFAAKEAILKAMGVPKGLQWHELEVRGGGGAPPQFHVSGRAKECLSQRGVVNIHLSLTHSRDAAVACVVLESGR